MATEHTNTPASTELDQLVAERTAIRAELHYLADPWDRDCACARLDEIEDLIEEIAAHEWNATGRLAHLLSGKIQARGL